MLIRAAAVAFCLFTASLFAGFGFAQQPSPAPAQPEPTELPAELPPGPVVPQYKVEVVIFAYRDIDQNEERFDHRPPLTELANEPIVRREPRRFDGSNLESLTTPNAPNEFGDAASLPPDGAAAPFQFRLLTPEELELTNHYRALERISAYVPLVHAGWVQQGLPENEARPFDLATLGALNPAGTIRLHLSRFLHLKVDLSYQSGSRPSAAQAPFGARELNELDLSPRYRLHAERLARSGELHYFDHPAFGLLVRVTPLPVDAPPVAIGGAVPAA